MKRHLISFQSPKTQFFGSFAGILMENPEIALFFLFQRVDIRDFRLESCNTIDKQLLIQFLYH